MKERREGGVLSNFFYVTKASKEIQYLKIVGYGVNPIKTY